jgi:hypothetical protein
VESGVEDRVNRINESGVAGFMERDFVMLHLNCHSREYGNPASKEKQRSRQSSNILTRYAMDISLTGFPLSRE